MCTDIQTQKWTDALMHILPHQIWIKTDCVSGTQTHAQTHKHTQTHRVAHIYTNTYTDSGTWSVTGQALCLLLCEADSSSEFRGLHQYLQIVHPIGRGQGCRSEDQVKREGLVGGCVLPLIRHTYPPSVEKGRAA